ncbi:MAG: hypothetical protein RIQ89_2243 [Bacteroidota bacterium]|jgi:2-(1,2-epoxy-1,2-dihydrophenyl)acetyl-CoA isomerase
MSETLNVTIVGESIMLIALNRPEKFNSFNREMALALQAALDNAGANSQIRCVVITGNGKAFCAGQDLSEAVNPDGPGIAKIVMEHYNPIILKIRNLAKPVVAMINGVAAGAGANIALCCDIAIASHSASFIQAFSKIGLVPDSGGSFTLPRLVGWQRASALMITGDKVSADEAHKMGMIYRATSAESLYDETIKLAETLASMPTKAIAQTKQMLNSSAFNNLETQLSVELHEQVIAAQSADYKEGVAAFLEKRQPVFKGL